MTDIPESGATIEIGGTIATCIAVDGRAPSATIYLRTSKGNADIIMARVPNAQALRGGRIATTLSVRLEDCIWAKKGYVSDEDSQFESGYTGLGSEPSKQLKTFQRGLHCRLRVLA